jgi:integrase
MREIRKVLPLADEATAYQWLEGQRGLVKSGQVAAPPQRLHFGEFAALLMERKLAAGSIRGQQGRNRWKCTLEHLVDGIRDSDGRVAVRGFGEIYLDRIRVGHVEEWKADVGKLLQAGRYAPTTANSWLAILRTIMKAAKREFELPRLATEGVADFDLSTHVVYTEEAPNALTPEQVPEFLNRMREMFPQHYAMTFLGFATGLRPSSLRPLRRSGASADVQWDKNRILVRRSQTGPNEVKETTKQKVRYRIEVPPEVMQVLRWHVQTQLDTPEQQGSELLFPSVKGEFRAVTSLCKPFAAVAKDIKLPFVFSPRGMRRTFNDLARASNVEAIVTRSISGHLTEEMQNHYSTVRGPEQRDGISRVVDLMTAPSAAAPSGTQGGTQGDLDPESGTQGPPTIH